MTSSAGIEFPEPAADTADAAVLFIRYLEFYRETGIAKVAALAADEQRRTRLPSGWTPLELLNHLAFMERRWFVWGFLGEHLDDPWGDDVDDRWQVADERNLDDVARMLREVGERVSAVLASTPLDQQAPPGPRFEGEPATLAWICFHVLQEYARHAGHLDIAVELAGGPTGE
ncbi:MAG: DUF664 domain-containing protein [Nocardioidaceae bacterium]